MAVVLRSEEPNDGGGGGSEVEDGRLLDGFLLLAAGGSATPDDVVSANLTSLQLVEVADEDLTFFNNLDRLDVSDNRLCHEHVLRQFGRLPRVTSLSLACNSLASLQVTSGTLDRLEMLDLSFNSLQGEVLGQLAALPQLRTLSLAANCISCLPSERELSGLQALEDLNLDRNDLVQFVQWRALDAVPRLRKLSLVSNRIRRLKDDLVDVHQPSYFRCLEELDLSSNEISSMEHLPLLPLFQALKVLKLSDNPITQSNPAVDERMTHVTLCAQQTRQWYLCGNGCFQKRPPKEPRLKLDRRRLRRVRSTPANVGPRQRRANQLCIFDEETNALIIDLQDQASAATAPPPEGTRKPPLLPPISTPSGSAAALPALSDDLTEEELDQLLKDRWANIQAKFDEPVAEPASFRRPPPFANSAMSRKGEALTSTLASVPKSMASLNTSQASQLFNLTSLDEDAVTRDCQSSERGWSGARPRPRGASSSFSAATAFAEALMEPSGDPSPLSPSNGTHITLPTLRPGSRSSRCSSASGGSRSATPNRGGGGARLAPLPAAPLGVREAMRAIRAAATEYAVGAF